MFNAPQLLAFMLASTALAAPLSSFSDSGPSLSQQGSSSSTPHFGSSSLYGSPLHPVVASSPESPRPFTPRFPWLSSSTLKKRSPSPTTLEPEYATVSPAPDASNLPLWSQDTTTTVEPIRGNAGASNIVPDDEVLDRQNPDFFAPPSTDHGLIPNAKWPMALGHNRLQDGGWARQENVEVFPFATAIAGVQMRLEAGAIRELHWHSTAEWAYVLKGTTVVTAVNPDGQIFSDAVHAGDLWYFPPGIPHSLQASADDSDGTEFLLVFDNGTFSEYSTFQLTDWTAHTPKEVLAKNFQLDQSAFARIPSKELYIFPAVPPSDDEQPPVGEAGFVPNPFTYHLSQKPATLLSGGTMKIFDTRNFKAATTIVGALVTVEPGAMRELHWHPTQPEWDYFITGEGRMTLFASGGTANTFDYRSGDVAYVPPSYGHYIENTGNTTLTYLELFNSDKVQDISLQQWLALTPPALVKAHLGLDDETIAHLNKTKQYVVGPSK